MAGGNTLSGLALAPNSTTIEDSMVLWHGFEDATYMILLGHVERVLR